MTKAVTAVAPATRSLHREIHILPPHDDNVALCGHKRDRPWRWGNRSREATCAVCLALWEGKLR